MFGRGSNAFSRAQAHVKTADEMRLAWCLVLLSQKVASDD
jgi:hypothetical protein